MSSSSPEENKEESISPLPPQAAYTGVPIIRVIESHNAKNGYLHVSAPCQGFSRRNTTATASAVPVPVPLHNNNNNNNNNDGVSTYPGLRRAVVTDEYTALYETDENVNEVDYGDYEEQQEEEDDEEANSCISCIAELILWTMVTSFVIYNWMLFAAHRRGPTSLYAANNVNSIIQGMHGEVEIVPEVRNTLQVIGDGVPPQPPLPIAPQPQPEPVHLSSSYSKDYYYDSNQLWGNTFVKHGQDDQEESSSSSSATGTVTVTAPSYHFLEAPQLDDDGMLLNMGQVYLSFPTFPTFQSLPQTTTISFTEYSFDEDSRMFRGNTLMSSSFLTTYMSMGTNSGGIGELGGFGGFGGLGATDQYVRHEIQFDPEFTCINSGRIVVLQEGVEEEEVPPLEKERDLDEKETVVHSFGNNDWSYVNAALLGKDDEHVSTAEE